MHVIQREGLGVAQRGSEQASAAGVALRAQVEGLVAVEAQHKPWRLSNESREVVEYS